MKNVKQCGTGQAFNGCGSGLELTFDAGVHFFFFDELAPVSLFDPFSDAGANVGVVLQQAQRRVLNQFLGIDAFLPRNFYKLCRLFGGEMHFDTGSVVGGSGCVKRVDVNTSNEENREGLNNEMANERRIIQMEYRGADRLSCSMISGPILIFDKSALESLNPDEANWLDNFFQTNITPLFFIETLADLEKQVHLGRTPEQVVGNLAYKTPDMQSRPNVHHWRLLNAELSGVEPVVMDGKGVISGGKPVMLEGETGLVFQRTQEEEAFHRWQRHEFLDVERLSAKSWRRSLTNINCDKAYATFQKWFADGQKPKNLSDVKSLVDAKIDKTDQEYSLRFGMSLLGIAPSRQEQVTARWQSAGKPPIREFAPYFRYVFSIDLFFYLAIAADHISRVRPSNKVDLAYLYYLPFCKIFTSKDSLHERVVPLFLRADQTFVKAMELKADLAKLDEHYSRLPRDVTDRGLFHFAAYPPTDSSFLVTRLWDKHMPTWRRQQEDRKPLDERLQRVLMDLVKRVEKDAVPVSPVHPINFDEAAYVHMQQSVYFRKGKWKRFPPEVALKSKQKI